jgi:hypothetical protein
MVAQEKQEFLDRLRPSEYNSPMSCVLVLLMTINVAVEVVTVGCFYPSFYIQGGGEVTRKVTESVTT